ncbi:MAG: B12-binding domain-containing radical SAM protein [Deltaproteobacteria bacterium]|nr:B12-binding domain-containing radical SAM protein [Deltaproteobacteria bacterium]
MRIALVGAEFEENLAIRYIRGALEADGHEVVQLVFNDVPGLERVAKALAESGAELAGFSLVFTRRARQFAALARRARELGFAGHLTAGGHFATFNAEVLLREVDAFDSVVCGEGELPMQRLARGLEGLDDVRGLVWRDPDGLIVCNPPAEKPADLDALPWPAHRKPYDRYLGFPIANVLGSRGCTHSCAFCSIAAWHAHCGGERFRMRSPENLAGELAALWGEGVRIFNFHDDNFLPGSRDDAFARVRALRDELLARGVGRIGFAIKARPDEVDEELFAFLKSMGLFRVFLGIEAGTADSLRRLGRGQSLDDNRRALDVMHRLDLHACFNLLLFNPDSTLEDVAANVAFLRARPRNPMNFCRTEIYAGTPLERRLRAQGRLVGDWWGWDYRIGDPRAESAFQVAFAAFRERNYGERGLHHTTMRVDYEYQVFEHFHGRDEALRRRVKAFVVDANLDTCSRLEELLERVAAGFRDETEEREWAAAAAERVREADARLVGGAERILDDLRDVVAARGGRRRTAWARKAAAAGLAAALAAAPACKKGPNDGASHPTEMAPEPEQIDYSTVMCEMVAPPPEPADAGTQVREMVPEPPADAGAGPAAAASPDVTLPADAAPGAPDAAASVEVTTDAVPPIVDSAVLRSWFDTAAMWRLADEIIPSHRLQVELWIDADGRVTHAELHGISLRAERKQALVEYLESLSAAGQGGPAGRYLFEVTREQLDEVRASNSQIFEEAPYPYPDTHMHERAPEPSHTREMIAPPPELQKKK